MRSVSSAAWLVPLAAACAACSGDEPSAVEIPVAAPNADRSADARPVIATVVALTGDVRFRRVDEASWVQLRVGQDLRARDTLQTMSDGTARVRFVPSGAESDLESGTTMQLPAAPRGVARLRHVSGRLIVRYEPGRGQSRLEVDLPPGRLIMTDDGAMREDARPGERRVVEARVLVSDGSTQVGMVRGRGRIERNEGTTLDVDEQRFVEVETSGALLETGWMGDVVVLVGPRAGATAHTRGPVHFSWQPNIGVETYQLELAAGSETALTAVRTVERTEASLELSSGSYRWAVRGIKDGEPQLEREPRPLIVNYDRTPPPLELSSPRENVRISNDSVPIRGSTEAGARLTIDGRALEVQSDGSFRGRHRVRRGLTNVVFRVSDPLGNTRTVTRSVNRQ